MPCLNTEDATEVKLCVVNDHASLRKAFGLITVQFDGRTLGIPINDGEAVNAVLAPSSLTLYRLPQAILSAGSSVVVAANMRLRLGAMWYERACSILLRATRLGVVCLLCRAPWCLRVYVLYQV